MKITIYNEGRDERRKPEVLELYPKEIGGVIRELLQEKDEIEIIKICSAYEEECGLTEELLNKTDVLVYWSHGGNAEFPDHVAERIRDSVLRGMGFVVLHSAIGAKPFKLLMGTSCSMRYKHDDFEKMICCNPLHPIAEGVPERFDLEVEETYGEFMDIPKPDDVIYLGWFDSGEACRSVCTWIRGYGRIVFLQPGHETNPSFYNPHVRKLIQNSCKWAKRTKRILEVPNSVEIVVD